MEQLCHQYETALIADEVQSGFSRSGTFFAFQNNNIKPHIITMAKGMGNGFPIGGILVHPDVRPKYGMWGLLLEESHGLYGFFSGFGNPEKTSSKSMPEKWKPISGAKQKKFKGAKIKGRGLMLGLEFDFEVGPLEKGLSMKNKYLRVRQQQ